MRNLNRRQLIARLARGAALACVGAPLPARLPGEDLEAARALLEKNPSFDLHCHPALFPVKEPVRSSNPRQYRGDDVFASRVRGMLKAPLWAGFFTLVTDAPILGMTPQGPGAVRRYEPGEAWAEYRRQLRVLDELVAANPVSRALSAGEVDAIHARGEVAAFYCCEGGDHLEGKPERVEQIFQDGVRHIQLVHVAPNDLADAAGSSPDHGGLSRAGENVVREMNRLGMVVDLAHASPVTIQGAVEVSRAPVIVSHAMLARQSVGRMVGLSREEGLLVADTGGVVGAFGGTGRSLDDYVAEIVRLVDVIGIDHVALGSDMDGTGGRATFDDYTELPRLVAGLLSRGLSEREVSKIVGGNMTRVFRAVEKRAGRG